MCVPLEEYVKPVMEIDETEEDIILDSGCPSHVVTCSGPFGYGGGGGGGGGNPR